MSSGSPPRRSDGGDHRRYLRTVGGRPPSPLGRRGLLVAAVAITFANATATVSVRRSPVIVDAPAGGCRSVGSRLCTTALHAASSRLRARRWIPASSIRRRPTTVSSLLVGGAGGPWPPPRAAPRGTSSRCIPSRRTPGLQRAAAATCGPLHALGVFAPRAASPERACRPPCSRPADVLILAKER
jgi:hypothetical protein